MRGRAFLSLLFLATAGCVEADPGLAGVQASLDSILATVAASAGELQVKHQAQGVWEPAATASTLYPGDWVRTGSAASARVEFLTGGALELDEDAVVVIEALRKLEKTGPDLPDSAPLVAVQSGAIRSTLADQAGKARPLLLRDADGSETRVDRRSEAGPAELRVASVAGATEVSVAQGEVKLASAGREEVVAQGTAAALGKQGVRRLAMLKAPTLESPAADHRAQQGKQLFKWQPVANATRYKVQVSKGTSFQKVELSAEQEGTQLEFDGAVGTHWWRVAAREESGRQSPWSTPRRLFLEREAPVDLLLEPDDGASYGFADGPPRIGFRWTPREGARAYRLVVSRSRDLLEAPVASEGTTEPTARVETLTPGEYFWGAFAQGTQLEPLFVSPRRLVVKKVSGGAVVAPKHIRKWGE